MRHGPVDDLNVRARRKKGGEGRAEVGAIAAKECPECGVLNALRAMARGSRVALLLPDDELTTQQAADILGVSRPRLVRMLDELGVP